MLATLLVVIFISFIGVGLPDSVLGTAWPTIYREFSLPISYAGMINLCGNVATIASSLLSARLIKKLGVGLVTALSTLLTAIALLGYSLTTEPLFLFLLAVPLGFGAGSIDTALNNFVALHYSASAMSFLHFSYGIGVAASPYIMSFALGDGADWRKGYFYVAVIQFAITAVTFLSLPIWYKIQKKDRENGGIYQNALSIAEVARMKNARLSCFAFFGACALELTVGGWSSSYFVNTKGIAADRAAVFTMLFYIGLASGRFLSGVLTPKLGRHRILYISLAILPFSLVMFALPLPVIFATASLFLTGLAIGPIYPNLVHLTPENVGAENAQSVMGAQQAMSYLGTTTMPWFLGFLAQYFSTAVMPYYLFAMLIIYAVPFLLLMKETYGKK